MSAIVNVVIAFNHLSHHTEGAEEKLKWLFRIVTRSDPHTLNIFYPLKRGHPLTLPTSAGFCFSLPAPQAEQGWPTIFGLPQVLQGTIFVAIISPHRQNASCTSYTGTYPKWSFEPRGHHIPPPSNTPKCPAPSSASNPLFVWRGGWNSSFLNLPVTTSGYAP